jgi:hypothetical protein
MKNKKTFNLLSCLFLCAASIMASAAEALRRHVYATANYGKAQVSRDPKTYGFYEEISGWVGSFYYPFGGHIEKQ